MKVRTKIQNVWIQTVEDSRQMLRASISRLLPASVSDQSSILSWNSSSSIDGLETVTDELIKTGLPALARRFNVILASDDCRNLGPYLTEAIPVTGIPALEILVYDMLVYKRVAWLTGRSPKRDGRRHLETSLYSDDRKLAFDSREVGALSIRCLRQILGLYGRLTVQLLSTDPAVAQTLEKFKERVSSKVPSASDLKELPFSGILARLGYLFFRGYSLDGLATGDPRFRFAHGPGAVAERYSYDEKGWVFATDDASYDAISEIYFRTPFEENSWRGRYHSWSRLGSSSSRVVAVPKDFRGPRIIAAEPALHQYVQKGVDTHLRSFLKRSVLKNVVQLDDQNVNASLALEGSKTREFSTLDLSDASDTVRMSHLEIILMFRKDLLEWFQVLRTKQVSIGKEVVNITTAFPMGSALCFPVESIVFALSVLAVGWSFLPFTGKNSPTFALLVRAIDELGLHVYGDDIVVRTKYALPVIDGLTALGFNINRTKCCFRGNFRESCGTDALCGHDVTPLRPRLLPGASREQLSSFCDQIRNFAERGYIRTAVSILRYAQEKYRLIIPIIAEGPPTEGVVVSRDLYFLTSEKVIIKYSKANFSWYIYAPRFQTRSVGDPNSYRRLMDALTRFRGEEPSTETAGPVSETGRIKFRPVALRSHLAGVIPPNRCGELLS